MLSSMCPAIDPFAEAGGNIDPFAADLGEISFSDVVVIDAEPASSQALVTPPRRKAPVPKGRNRKELSARTPNKLQKTEEETPDEFIGASDSDGCRHRCRHTLRLHGKECVGPTFSAKEAMRHCSCDTVASVQCAWSIRTLRFGQCLGALGYSTDQCSSERK